MGNSSSNKSSKRLPQMIKPIYINNIQLKLNQNIRELDLINCSHYCQDLNIIFFGATNFNKNRKNQIRGVDPINGQVKGIHFCLKFKIDFKVYFDF